MDLAHFLNLLIHCGHLGYFHLLVIVKRYAMIICIQIFFEKWGLDPTVAQWVKG